MSTVSSQVLDALHPSEPIYAVLDGARDRRMKAWIDSTRAPAWCLLRGELHPELAQNAPYLMRLGRGHAFTEQFFGMGFGNAWGILFASSASSSELRRHLRRFLRARTEAGKILAFRYYDPRVLRLYLPTCTPEEIKIFFGPITAMAAEAKEKDRLHVFRSGPAGLVAKRFELARAAAPEPQPASPKQGRAPEGLGAQARRVAR